MAYTPLKGIFQDNVAIPMGDYQQYSTPLEQYDRGMWKADPNVNYGTPPEPGMVPVFDKQGTHYGWEQPHSLSAGGSGLFGDFGDANTWRGYYYDANGNLQSGSGGVTPSKNSMTNFMSYAMPVAMAAGLGAGAAGGAFGGTGAAASGASGGAIPGMSAGGWGVMDASLMAPGAFEAAMAAAPAAGAAGATGVSGTSAAAGGAGAGLPAATAPTGGGGMSSFLPDSLGGWASAIKDWAPLLGAIGGAAQGSQNQTVTNQTQLPPWLQSLGPQLTNAAVNAANQPFQSYTGQRIEPFNPNQQAAFGMTQQRAMNGSPVEQSGQNAMMRAANGNANPMFGLDNPYLNKQIDNAVGDVNRNFNKTVVPQLDAMNVRANTGFGTSSGMDEMRGEAYRNLNETTGKLSNDMRYKDYYNQTQLGEGMAGRQLQAAGLAPNLGAMDYRNIDALLGVGNQQQQLGQAGQDFNYSEFMRQLQYPDQQLQRLGYPFGFNQGQTSTTTTPGVGAWAGGISGLLGGIGMGNMMGNGTAVSNASQMTPPPNVGQRLDQYNPYTNPYTGKPWGVA